MVSIEGPVSGVGAYGVTTTPGTLFMMNSAATVAFGFPTSLGLPTRKENARQRVAPEQEYTRRT